MAFLNPSKSPKVSAFPTDATQVEDVVQELSDPAPQNVFADQVAELEEMDEAERRSIKANYYREIIHMQLFGDDEESEAYEVEKEIQEFAKERMRVFLGMIADGRAAPAAKTVAIKLPFNEKQLQVLTGWADSLIQRPELLARLTPPPRGRQATDAAQPVSEAPIVPRAAPVPTQSVTQADPGRARRGRPPGTGKHQRAARQSAQETAPDLSKAVAVKVNTQGAKIDTETGKPYIDVESIDAKGNTVFKKHFVEEQTTPTGAQPKPWPMGHSPLENEGGVSNMRISGGLESGTSKAVPLGGQLSQAIKHFSQ